MMYKREEIPHSAHKNTQINIKQIPYLIDDVVTFSQESTMTPRKVPKGSLKATCTLTSW